MNGSHSPKFIYHLYKLAQKRLTSVNVHGLFYYEIVLFLFHFVDVGGGFFASRFFVVFFSVCVSFILFHISKMRP